MKPLITKERPIYLPDVNVIYKPCYRFVEITGADRTDTIDSITLDIEYTVCIGKNKGLKIKDKMNLTKLSQRHRLAHLCKACGLNARQLRNVRELIGNKIKVWLKPTTWTYEGIDYRKLSISRYHNT